MFGAILDFPLLDFLPAKEAVWELKGIFFFLQKKGKDL
jgi:hypothetical protein